MRFFPVRVRQDYVFDGHAAVHDWDRNRRRKGSQRDVFAGKPSAVEVSERLSAVPPGLDAKRPCSGMPWVAWA